MRSAEEADRDWDAARRRTVLTARLTAALGAVGMPALSAPAVLLARVTGSGRLSYLAVVGWMGLLCLPLVLLIWRLNDRQMRRSNREVRRAGEELREMLDRANADAVRQQAQAQQKEFETELANALEMAEGETEVLAVIEHAFDLARPESPVELLLADNSHAHLLRVARSSSAHDQRGCQVDSPDHCPAARRGQTQRFADSEKLGACPKLREHGAERCSAVCVPVSIMGRTVGVVHATGTVEEPMSETDVAALNTVASLGGARLGMIRMVAEVALQASTDSLTGLLNRRAFERAVTATRKEHSSVAVAMADLDHFKALNDTYGHETGDRALRVFAQTLRTCVRTSDLVARHGGEEFAIALPDCSAEDAMSILETLRVQIERSAAQAGLPQFTASFGVVEIGPDEDLPAALGRADQALFEAKRSGRNRVVQSLRTSPEAPAPAASPIVAAVTEDAPAA